MSRMAKGGSLCGSALSIRKRQQTLLDTKEVSLRRTGVDARAYTFVSQWDIAPASTFRLETATAKIPWEMRVLANRRGLRMHFFVDCYHLHVLIFAPLFGFLSAAAFCANFTGL